MDTPDEVRRDLEWNARLDAALGGGTRISPWVWAPEECGLLHEMNRNGEVFCTVSEERVTGRLKQDGY